MKYIITDNKNVVMHISDTIEYQSNGNVLVDNDTLAIAKPLVKGVHEVENIDEDVCENKYCYTEEAGFYENANYVEPVDPNAEMEALKQQITDLQLAMVEMYEGGQANG